MITEVDPRVKGKGRVSNRITEVVLRLNRASNLITAVDIRV